MGLPTDGWGCVGVLTAGTGGAGVLTAGVGGMGMPTAGVGGVGVLTAGMGVTSPCGLVSAWGPDAAPNSCTAQVTLLPLLLLLVDLAELG